MNTLSTYKLTADEARDWHLVMQADARRGITRPNFAQPTDDADAMTREESDNAMQVMAQNAKRERRFREVGYCLPGSAWAVKHYNALLARDTDAKRWHDGQVALAEAEYAKAA